jgi:endogenous inhibitor of DNA gyrase (YacG/DUF329 family)
MNKVQCPICDEDMQKEWSAYPEYPFCSPRCKLIDLGRWLGEGYKLAEPADEEDLSTVPDSEE